MLLRVRILHLHHLMVSLVFNLSQIDPFRPNSMTTAVFPCPYLNSSKPIKFKFLSQLISKDLSLYLMIQPH